MVFVHSLLASLVNIDVPSGLCEGVVWIFLGNGIKHR